MPVVVADHPHQEAPCALFSPEEPDPCESLMLVTPPKSKESSTIDAVHDGSCGGEELGTHTHCTDAPNPANAPPQEQAAASESRVADVDSKVRDLQETGAIRQVFGSQSMLSQELPADLAEDEFLLDATTAASTRCKTSGHFIMKSQESAKSSDDENNAHVKTKDANSQHDDDNSACSPPTTMSFTGLSQETLGLASSANFGTLLDAVEIAREEEETVEKRLISARSAVWNRKIKRRRLLISRHQEDNGDDDDDDDDDGDDDIHEDIPKSKKIRGFQANVETTKKNVSISLKRDKLPHNTKGMIPDRERATEAAALAARAVHDTDLAKQLLLSMALSRTNPRSVPDELPGKGHVLGPRFFWSKYPPLEKVLKDSMPNYYRLSMTQCQSNEQTTFNSKLVDKVRVAARARGWIFDPTTFVNDKDLRDRIRCYYKTHIQNAKKRLNTMLRNPTKRANAIHLMQHFDLIQKTVDLKEEEKKKVKGSEGEESADESMHDQEVGPHED